MISEKMGYKQLYIVLSVLISTSFANEAKYKPKPDDIAPSVTVTHYDCSEMTENNLYSLNQVKPCNFAPENIELSDASINLYTQHFRTEVNATICSVKHQRNRFHCGMHDHTSIDITQPQITSYVDLSPTECKNAAEGKAIKLFGHSITMKIGEKQEHHFYNGNKIGRASCRERV